MSRRRYGYKPTQAPPIAPEFLRLAFTERPAPRPIGLELCRRCSGMLSPTTGRCGKCG